MEWSTKRLEERKPRDICTLTADRMWISGEAAIYHTCCKKIWNKWNIAHALETS